MLTRPAHVSAVAVAAWLAVLPGAALAHSVVIGTDPAEGAHLTKAPTTLTVRFNEAIRKDFAYAKLTVDDDTAVDTSAKVDGSSFVVTPKHALDDGSYTLAYRIASEDTHPVSGVVHFTVATAGSASATAVPSTSTSAGSATTAAAPSSAAKSSAASPTTGTSPSAQSESKPLNWLPITALGVLAAVAGIVAGRAYRNRGR